jgi:hypothetical protein
MWSISASSSLLTIKSEFHFLRHSSHASGRTPICRAVKCAQNVREAVGNRAKWQVAKIRRFVYFVVLTSMT